MIDVHAERVRWMQRLAVAAAAVGLRLPAAHVNEAGDVVEYIRSLPHDAQWRIGLVLDPDPAEAGAHFVARPIPGKNAPTWIGQVPAAAFDPTALVAAAVEYQRAALDDVQPLARPRG